VGGVCVLRWIQGAKINPTPFLIDPFFDQNKSDPFFDPKNVRQERPIRVSINLTSHKDVATGGFLKNGVVLTITMRHAHCQTFAGDFRLVNRLI
jgi:hypothetical protein